MCYISAIFFFFFHQIFILSVTLTYLYISPQIFSPSKFEHCGLKTPKFELPKILIGTLSPTTIVPKQHKNLKLILVLTMTLLYTYFWLTVPACAFIWVPFFKRSLVAQPSSNYLINNQNSKRPCGCFECHLVARRGAASSTLGRGRKGLFTQMTRRQNFCALYWASCKI